MCQSTQTTYTISHEDLKSAGALIDENGIHLPFDRNGVARLFYLARKYQEATYDRQISMDVVKTAQDFLDNSTSARLMLKLKKIEGQNNDYGLVIQKALAFESYVTVFAEDVDKMINSFRTYLDLCQTGETVFKAHFGENKIILTDLTRLYMGEIVIIVHPIKKLIDGDRQNYCSKYHLIHINADHLTKKTTDTILQNLYASDPPPPHHPPKQVAFVVVTQEK